MRARAEAAETATLPMTWILAVAAACAVGLGAVAVGAAWPTVHQAIEEMAWWLSRTDLDAPAVAELVRATMRPSAPLLLAAACLVLAPIALYFGLSDE